MLSLKVKEYDTVVIGAGIVGCCVAYMLQKKGIKVLLVDRSALVASGGSGAAGAFVSPKIGKGSPLQTITNLAFDFSKNFYLQHFSEFFHQTSVVRIPKDLEDAQKFSIYETFITSNYSKISKDKLLSLGIKDCEDSFIFDDAGVCDAQSMCKAILKEIPFLQLNVEDVSFEDNRCIVGEYSCKNIVLSTGYQNSIFDMRYMGVKGTWGSRGDYSSSLDMSVSMHKNISVSANINGTIKIGATHQKSKNPCMECNGNPLENLYMSASKMVDTSDFVLKETFCGMRAGSKDYFPLVGKVIDVPHMLTYYPSILKGSKPNIQYLDNIYVCNGVGGRGFVFAPYIADILTSHIVDNRPIDSRINSDRLFLKWCRKLAK